MKVTISLAQMDVRTGDVATNLAEGMEMIREAARRGSQLVVLPELWLTGYDLENAEAHAAALYSVHLAQVTAEAAVQQIAVAGSLLAPLPGGGVGNTAVYIDASGQIAGLYSKVHLFGPMSEKRYLQEGQSLSMVPTGWGNAGLAICYDLRFPELFRAYALGGAQMVILAAEWPRPRLEHWRILLRARAIENQMLIAACNRVGRSDETEFFGRSAIVNACGETVVEGGDQADLLTATVEMDDVARVRASMPVLTDRRPPAYQLGENTTAYLSDA